MLFSGPSGFRRAPATKAICLVTGAFSFLNAFLPAKYQLFPLALSGLSRGQVWRLLTCHFVFQSSSEIIFGISLLYAFRVFERQYSTRLYSSALLALVLFSTSLQLLALGVLPSFSVASPGPYAIIFGLFPTFFLDIPATTRIRIFGVTFSDKIIAYLFGLQVMFSKTPESAITALCCLLAGIIYRAGQQFFLRTIRVPSSVVQWCDQHLRHFLESRRRRGAYEQLDQNAEGAEMAAMHEPVAHHDGDGDVLVADVPAGPAPRPDDRAVASLVSMGFPEAEVRNALVLTRNNVQAAMDRLLGGH